MSYCLLPQKFQGNQGPSKWDNNTEYYKLRVGPGGPWWTPGMCSGYARMFITGRYDITNDKDAIAWGYDGVGPLYCASAIIYHVISGQYNPPHKLTKSEMVTVRRFMKKVVVNLPNNWDMTATEVRQWIKDGTLPKCITNKPKDK